MTIECIAENTYTLNGTTLDTLTDDGKSYILPQNDENIRFCAVSKLAKLEPGQTFELHKIDRPWLRDRQTNKPAGDTNSNSTPKLKLDTITELKAYIDNEDDVKTFDRIVAAAIAKRNNEQQLAKAQAAYKQAIEALKALGLDPSNM